MKERYDERAKDVPYEVGDVVWIYIPIYRLNSRRIQIGRRGTGAPVPRYFVNWENPAT